MHLIALTPAGTEYARFGSVDLSLASGTQYIRLNDARPGANGVAVENLNAIRITVDGGYPGMLMVAEDHRDDRV